VDARPEPETPVTIMSLGRVVGALACSSLMAGQASRMATDHCGDKADIQAHLSSSALRRRTKER
jgi:hypothetical protein